MTLMLAGASTIFCSKPVAVTTTASRSLAAGAGAGSASAAGAARIAAMARARVAGRDGSSRFGIRVVWYVPGWAHAWARPGRPGGAWVCRKWGRRPPGTGGAGASGRGRGLAGVQGQRGIRVRGSGRAGGGGAGAGGARTRDGQAWPRQGGSVAGEGLRGAGRARLPGRGAAVLAPGVRDVRGGIDSVYRRGVVRGKAGVARAE